jgi:trans-2,3-dihydro-3-hydroxyanthranilate isomerase
VRVRFFTPSAELPFAGHPTIGTHVVLASLGRYEITGPVTRIFQQVGVGVLPVDLITDGNGLTDRAVMTQDEARHGGLFEDRARLAKALGLEPEDIHPELPAQVYSTGLPGLIVPVVSLEAIQRVTLNIGAFNDMCRSMSVTGAEVFTLDTVDKAHHMHVRNFDPLVGVYEDPATGSMAGALGAYLLGKGAFEYEFEASTTHMVVEQGYEIGRPSLIEVEVDIAQGAVSEVRVGGQVVIVMEGELRLQ